MSQKKSGFNNLDLNNIGNWPQAPSWCSARCWHC